jgi:arylsulfatase A-like enzyme
VEELRNRRSAQRIARSRALLACAAGATALLAGCPGGSDAPPPRADATWPNVVLVSIDTLRPDHLGCYGYSRATSPRIDALAAEGALFENVISSTSWTLPAHAALFTGLGDSAHGCYDTDRALDDSRTTLAERLKAMGYATAGFFSGPYLHPVFGLAQGFDSYVDCTSYAELSMRTAASTGTVEDNTIENESHRDITSPRLTEAVRRWLQSHHEERPFFLFAHMWDVHFDYIPPAPYDTMFDPDYTGDVTCDDFYFNEKINPKMSPRDLEHVVALYDGEIAWTDMHLGKILDEIDALGLRESTILIIVSDHGTEFFEHGGKIHRRTLFDEVIRIPLIVRAPGRVPPGTRVAEQVRLIDVAPTILDFLGVARPRDVMGQSLAPLVGGRPLAEDNLAISELLTMKFDAQSFRRPERKLIANLTGDMLLFFDLRDDRTEGRAAFNPKSDLPWMAALRADRDTGRAALAKFRDMLPPATATPQLPESVLRQLRSAGYVGGGDDEADAPDSPSESPPTAPPPAGGGEGSVAAPEKP